MAIIGEKLSELLDQGDDFIGLRFGCRKDEDVIQIWNKEASIFKNREVFAKIDEIVPQITKKEYKSNQ